MITQRLLTVLLLLSSALFLPARAAAQFIGPVPVTVQEPQKLAPDTALLDSLLRSPYPKLLLRADDTVEIKLYGVKDFDLVRRIAADGQISLPLIGNVPAAGFSPDELERAIATRLIDQGMVKDPQVTVITTTLPSIVATVSGDVVRPGVFPALGQLTVMDYISLAGGLAKVAGSFQSPASTVVTLVRPGLAAPVTIPLGPDPKTSPYGRIPVFPGDEIRVGSTGFVYAVGAFRQQGGFPLKSSTPTTITDLVALAGGVGYEGRYGDAHIVRVSGAGHVLIPVNISRILSGKSGDVALQQDDILFLPTDLMKAALKGGGAGLIVGLATTLIYR